MKNMEPIDVLKVRKQMENDCNLKTFLKQPGNFVNASSMGVFGISSLATSNIVADMILLILSGYNLFRLHNKWDMYKDIDVRLALALEKTPVYSRMSENYFTYIHHLTVFLKQFGIKDTKELLCLLELMLETGYFSYNFSHEYHKYKVDTGEMSGTTGAHVVTGKCVCRHMASFFADVLYKFQIDACNVTVRVKDEYKVEEFIKQGRKQDFNHAVVGIIDGDHKFMFDPTNNVFIGRADTKFKGYKEDDVGQTEIKGKNSYVFTSVESLWMNKLHLDEYKKYKKLPMGEIDFDRIVELREKVLNFYLYNKKEFDDFYTKMLKLLQEVYIDIIQLSPKSDEEIKEWVLKY